MHVFLIKIFFQAGDAYEGKMYIYKIMKRASTKLVIIDQYMDDVVFDFVESLDDNLKVQFLTTGKKIFKQIYLSSHK